MDKQDWIILRLIFGMPPGPMTPDASKAFMYLYRKYPLDVIHESIHQLMEEKR